MKVISVQQPWAQLIADRRRHVIIKTWQAQPGERFELHASHVRNDELSLEWFKDVKREDLDRYVPKNAVLGVVEVVKCLARGEVRKSTFDRPNSPQKHWKPEYAIVVRTVEKYRKPDRDVIRPSFVPTGKDW